jgi:saccharopine dehydrogenase-like NADP-dependent oxidoreductase
MSKSVGVTAAIGARLILEGKIQMKGVVSPIFPEIYNPIL